MVILIAAITHARPAAALSTKISTFAVDAYPAPCAGPSLTNSIADANGFRTTMLSGTDWQAGLQLTNGAVLDTLFYDPELVANGSDSTGFDRPGDAISYFAGHGTCGFAAWQGRQPQEYCFRAQDCASPSATQNQWIPPGKAFASCAHYPPDGRFNACQYAYKHQMITCGSTALFGNVATHSLGSGGALPSLRFGESTNTPTQWAGAGTNGGVNVVVMHSSCPSHPGTIAEDIAGVLGGVHLVLTIVIRRGDTANVSARGSTFAAGYLADKNASVRADWLNTIILLNQGGGCVAGGGFVGGGINGCGAHVALWGGATQTEADSLKSSTWLQVQDDTRDAQGAQVINYDQQYNYDWAAYPPVL